MRTNKFVVFTASFTFVQLVTVLSKQRVFGTSKFVACISGFIDAVTASQRTPPPLNEPEFVLFGREPGTGYGKDDTIVTLTMANKKLHHCHTCSLNYR